MFESPYPDFDGDKASCTENGCTRSVSDEYSDEGVMWVCVSCLDIYCMEHNNNLFFYQPHFGVDGASGHDSTTSLLSGVSSEMDEILSGIEKENMSIWKEELNEIGYYPSEWGNMIEYEDHNKRYGYILCEDCKEDVMKVHESGNLHNPKKVGRVSRLLGRHGYEIDSNLLHHTTLEQEDFADRFVEVYG